MQHFNSPNVYYIEDTEITPDYRLDTGVLNPYTNQPLFSGVTIVMIQSTSCGFCSQLKPPFQKVANECSPMGIVFGTIQVDGQQPGEQVFQQSNTLNHLVQQQIQGVPMVVKFVQGRVVDVYTGEHEYESLKRWVLS